MTASLGDFHVVRLADHPELFRQAGILRWKEWAYGEKDPARFIDVTARETGDGIRLPMTLVAIDAAHNALGVVDLGTIDDEVSEAERAGRTPWILGMVVAKEARMLGIGRRLLEELQDAARTLGHRESWVATGQQAVGFYQRCGWEPVEWLRLESTGVPTTILVKHHG
jgi:GNAT superfamily N-acetyltransferase